MAEHRLNPTPAKLLTRACLLLAACATVAFLNFLFAGCAKDPRPKERPSDVPPAAVWAGGPDGGAWFDCSVGGNANRCTVWDDSDGSIVAKGDFLLDKPSRAATAAELRYTGFDGQRILLADNLVLRPIHSPDASRP